MIRHILALTVNNLAVSLKNKTIFLILFIPFFVFMSLKLVDRTGTDVVNIKIGLIQTYSYPPRIMQCVKEAGKMIDVTWVASEEDGKSLLKEKKTDGILVKNTNDPGSLSLLVLKKESLHTLAILESFAALQKAAEGNSARWISDVIPLYDGGVQRQSLPTWILMLTLLVGFIILPAQVAEEKEKKLLLSLLQTPIREVEWLIAQLIVGMILIIMAVVFLHLLGQFALVHPFDYTAIIVSGSFCFSASEILLGCLCRTQASARTLGLIFYLPLLLPSALSDFSQKLSAIAPFLPSYQFYEPLKSILLEDGRISAMLFEPIYLLLAGSLAFFLSYVLLKQRWLM